MLKFYNCATFDIMGDLTFSENLGLLDSSEYSSWISTVFGRIKAGSTILHLKKIHWMVGAIIDFTLMYSGKVARAAREHEEYALKRVDRRLLRAPTTPDLWTKILQKETATDHLSLAEHYDTASMFMIAGTETTGTVLSSTTYWLLRNPDKMKKAVAEIRENYHLMEDLHLDSLQRLKYLSAVIEEGLRMNPPVPTGLPRITPKGGMVINGHWVPGGVTVSVHQMATCRSEDYFSKPYDFHPERWLGDPRFKNDRLNANEPFSTGPRNCVGKIFAYHEMRLLLAAVLLNFDLQLCDESQNWKDQRVYGLWEKKPLWCTLKLAKV